MLVEFRGGESLVVGSCRWTSVEVMIGRGHELMIGRGRDVGGGRFSLLLAS